MSVTDNIKRMIDYNKETPKGGKVLNYLGFNKGRNSALLEVTDTGIIFVETVSDKEYQITNLVLHGDGTSSHNYIVLLESDLKPLLQFFVEELEK